MSIHPFFPTGELLTEPMMQKHTSKDDFSIAWQETFGETAPLAHVMRSKFPDAWTRFHALPESKRYASTKEEHATVLFRANTLGNACFPADAEIWFLMSFGADFDVADHDQVQRLNMSERFTFLEDFEDDDDEDLMRVFAAKVNWSPTSFDPLLTSIANDGARYALWFDAKTKTVFAPYDGGFDLFSFEPGRIQQLEKTFQDWMSSHECKL